jgi:hypothetical protein|tara:strand:+ start:124 stop:606 length:483 start_codon:yes stop_codon:yes gene_type:complete
MTKWARMRRRKERRRTEEALQSQPEGKEPESIQPEKISENIQHSQETEQLKYDKSDAKSVDKDFHFSKSNTILAQIPRYVYLAVIFSLLSGVFFPLITPGVPFDSVIQGTLALFLGLVGGILLFKTVTSDNRRGIFITVGFSLITISLVLIFWIQEESIF